MDTKYIFFPAILFIGIITSYEDIKIGKIRNKWIILGLIYSAVAFSVSAALHLFDPKLNAINFLVSIVIGYGLWKYKQWSAGDAKLFIVYSILIPCEAYRLVYIRFFPAFILLLATFILAFIYLSVRSFSSFIISPQKKELPLYFMRKIRQIRRLKHEFINILLGFFLIFLLRSMLSEKLNGFLGLLVPDRNTLIIVTFLLYNQLSRKFSRSKYLIWVFLSVMAGYFILNISAFQDSAFLYAKVLIILKALIWSILVMIGFSILEKLTALYTKATKSFYMPFAMWMFLGVLIVWFL